MFQEVFFIKIGESGCIVKSSKGTISFNLTDNVLKNGMIADFRLFETQLKAQLDKIGLKNFFKHKITVLALPPNVSDVEKRAFFDSLECIGSRETYLINEHFVLVQKIENLNLTNKVFGILDINDCKIDYSIVEGLNVTKSYSFNISKERFDKYLRTPSLKIFLLQSIEFDSQYFFSNYSNMKNFHLVLTGKNAEHFLLGETIVQNLSLKNSIIRVKDYDEFILNGLELVWGKAVRPEYIDHRKPKP